MMRRLAIKGAAESSICDICGADSIAGLTHYFQDGGKWWTQRQCGGCAIRLGDAQEARALRSIEIADEAGA